MIGSEKNHLWYTFVWALANVNLMGKMGIVYFCTKTFSSALCRETVYYKLFFIFFHRNQAHQLTSIKQNCRSASALQLILNMFERQFSVSEVFLFMQIRC